ncbi:ABC transporter ATP-binding protein [Celeribacter indicus]|uniref:ABC transporter n=1 Tax=Celeribacter indicus TaxID=1208324 RepID=A0A0B5E031_9RHOB|nr:ABC transporter ATP-binding protein [Celeribacter indicus]AJE46740.1 ABC transporter [Celeribacter indicus]SDX05309.1 iron(III) transport system ATP-binding protein [Celeribacter indicus]
MTSDAVLLVEDLEKHHVDASGHRNTAVDGLSFEMRQGDFYTLLGPSGCGKSTTLRAIAGLEPIDTGRITLHGQVLNDTAQGIAVPPNRRQLGMVFQSYAIWPHMTVTQNVAFPLRMQRPKLSSRDIAARVHEALAAVQLDSFSNRMATALSGGQQQRLALARALVARPRLLLLDEPLSNLDARLRSSMLAELTRLQRDFGTTALYVTHDQTEALSMSSRLAVMNQGRIVQEGSPADIYYRPADEFVARFVGEMNMLGATADTPLTPGTTGTVRLSDGTALPVHAAISVAKGQTVSLGARYESVTILPAGTPGPADAAILPAVLTGQVFLGEIRRWSARLPDGTELVATSIGRQADGLSPGSAVSLAIARQDLLVFPTPAATPPAQPASGDADG